MSQQIKLAIARIRTASGNAVGAGFLVNERYIITCAHVVDDALGRPRNTPTEPEDFIHFDFPLAAPDRIFTARVILWLPMKTDKSGDIAGLEITEDSQLPVEVKPAQLVLSEDLWGHTFRTFGFPKGRDTGVWASGELRSTTAPGWVQIENTRMTGYGVQPGFSGGPVWDESLNGIVGMTVVADTQQGIRAAFIIPAERLVAVWPELGMCTIPACPYRGLLPFREQDVSFFFGRDSSTDRLVEAVQAYEPFVTVMGPSGSGKSSVICSGLLPRLRQVGGDHPPSESWRIAQFRPGSHPFEELAGAVLPLLEPEMTKTDQLIEVSKLATALSRNEVRLYQVVGQILEGSPEASHLLLVIDQFEELYTLCSEPESRYRFLDILLEALADQARKHTSALTMVVAVQASFLGQVLASRPFSDALDQARKLMLGAMTREELEAAIAYPAERQGVMFEEGLTARILDDVGDKVGGLPLLEFALTQLWERQRSGRLTHAAYEAIGKVGGALTRYADDVYAGLGEAEQKQARQVFVQLVSPGEGTEDTRRLATRSELGEVNWELVRRLADARLVVIDRSPMGQEVAEVAHEALIWNWQRLRMWMEEDRSFRVFQEQLRILMPEHWRPYGEPDLLQGTFLANAERWLTERRDDLSSEERQYIEASVNARDRRATDERLEYLGQVTGGVVHRIGSKSGLIRLHVKNLRRLIPSESRDMHTILDKIERDNEYMLELGESLFRPAYAAETPSVSVDVNTLLDNAVRLADIPPDVELSLQTTDVPPVRGNRFLVDIFVELITNAIKAMEGQKKKELVIHSQPTDERHVAVAFEDSGCGIAPEEMSRLFNLFYTRGRDGEAPSSGGYGLWYCKTIITRMGGDLQIESEEGKGTTCTVLLKQYDEGGNRK